MNEELTRLMPALESFVRLRMGRKLSARESSEDIAQSACREVLQALASRPDVDAAELRRWLFRAADRKIHERARYWRAAKRDPARERPAPASNGSGYSEHAALFLHSLSPSREAVAREQLQELIDAFGGLPSDYRAAILYTHLGGLSIDELAVQLRRTPAATRTLLSRARARLASLLEKLGD